MDEWMHAELLERPNSTSQGKPQSLHFCLDWMRFLGCCINDSLGLFFPIAPQHQYYVSGGSHVDV